MCAIFGGQGPANPNCLEELAFLYRTNKPYLEELMDVGASTLSKLSTLTDTAEFYEEIGFDLKIWLSNPSLAPSKDILATAAFSFPIITLISLSHYCIACKTLTMSPGDFRDSLQAVTGHSQGIIAAAAVSKSEGWESFYESTRDAVEISFWTGYESYHTTPTSLLSESTTSDSEDCGEGRPSPMLSINGLNKTHIQRLIRELNYEALPEEHIYLALVNSREKMVVAGPSGTLRALNLRLRKIKAGEGIDQRRIPFNKRKPIVDHSFLPISAAFHSPCLNSAVPRVLQALKTKSITGKQLGVPLFHTQSGENLQHEGSNNVIETLVRAIMSEMMDWPMVFSRLNVSHLLDFGPGRTSSLMHELADGTGLHIIQLSERSVSSEGIGTRSDLFGPNMPSVPSNWGALYRPKLIKDSLGNIRLDTKVTRVFGLPPILVAGMTPTTVPWDFVAAVMKAGYYIELAGGGYSKSEDFEQAIRKLHATLPVGCGICCNLIYVNPRAMAWQIDLLRRLNRQGIQIDGLTIGAGIPSIDVFKEYVETVGLKYISLKPGSYESILQVINLATEFPGFSIGLQWTGGRAGGHHSFEDFHAPILKAYGRIRQCPNIVLIAGSGFGEAADSFPYLTGQWSCTIGYPLMPFDGVLLGSRMMVAQEAHTSPQAKLLIQQTEGVDDGEWSKTYDAPAGGVVTVKSEMGEPIHKLATRGVILWKDLDRRIFAIKDKGERRRVIHENRNDIITRLNRDFAKPWFAINSNGDCVEIEDMTYLEVINRLVHLMYVHHQKRWIHGSYRALVLDFVRRVQERLPAASDFIIDTFDDPSEGTMHFSRCYPLAQSEMIYPQDEAYLMSLFRRHGQKPVNFVPKLDDNFETWFKKDSLWQAEDVEAVPDQDVQRVCIIHGPVAARHSKVIDEPAAVILDAINQGLIDMLRQTADSNNISETSDVKGGLLPPINRPPLDNVFIEEQEMQTTYELGRMGNLPSQESLIQHMIGSHTGWLHACLNDVWICRGSQRLPNPIRAAFSPKHGDIIVVRYQTNEKIQSVTLTNKLKPAPADTQALEMRSLDGRNVIVTLFAPDCHSTSAVKINFKFDFVQKSRGCRLYEDGHRRNERIKELFAALWNGGLPVSLKNAGLTSEFSGKTVTLTQKLITDFMRVIMKSQSHLSTPRWCPNQTVPLDICIVVAWPALIKPLLISAIDVDLLSLLHRSNSFEYYPGAELLKMNDVVQSSSRISAVTIQPNGKLIEVVAEIRRHHEAVVKVTTTFFIQGKFSDYEKTFKSTQDPEVVISVTSDVLQALLLSKDWLILDEPASLIGKTFFFKTTTYTTYNRDASINELQVDGQIFSAEDKDTLRCVGKVYFEGELCNGNPVADFLTRHGSVRRKQQLLENPGWNGSSSSKIQIPKRNESYSKVSKDTNPIHACQIFAGYCHLPGTVVHGMYTSAAVRRIVETAVGDNDCTRFRRYSVSFEGMVLPGDILKVQWSHVAMVHGRMIIRIQAYNEQKKDKVLEAEAEVEQAPTAYLFCGQGSQDKGMGMSLYDTSAAAKVVWDRGDKYLRDLYGTDLMFKEFSSR